MLRPATGADLPFIRSLAQRPDYAPFITDEDEAALAGYLSDPSARVVIWEAGDGARGFAIYRGVGRPSGVVELLRIALAEAGAGRGARFFDDLLDHAFADLGATRLWFDASGENLRAMKVYERAGCVREGVQRAHWWRPALGRAVDLHLFGMLRSEWEARRAQACSPQPEGLHSR
jgi:RimJ/RimL family protein N-acetyltransferase